MRPGKISFGVPFTPRRVVRSRHVRQIRIAFAVRVTNATLGRGSLPLVAHLERFASPKVHAFRSLLGQRCGRSVECRRSYEDRIDDRRVDDCETVPDGPSTESLGPDIGTHRGETPSASVDATRLRRFTECETRRIRLAAATRGQTPRCRLLSRACVGESAAEKNRRSVRGIFEASQREKIQ